MKKNIFLIAASLFCGAALVAEPPQDEPAAGEARPEHGQRAENRRPGHPGMPRGQFSETDRVIFVLAEAYKATDNEETRAAIEKDLKARLTEAITQRAQAEKSKLQNEENELAQKLADPEKFADEIFSRITSDDFKPGFGGPRGNGRGFGPGEEQGPGFRPGFGPGNEQGPGFGPGNGRGPRDGRGAPGGQRGRRGPGMERRPDGPRGGNAPENGDFDRPEPPEAPAEAGN